MMMQPYAEGAGPNSIVDGLPVWDEVGEIPDHRQYIFHYHTMMCPQFMNGYCPRHKASRSAPPQCFCYHFESQRRRPLVDTLTGQMRYWDVLCDRVAEGEECLAGDLCPFSHTREEISYHAAKYKTKLCNDRDCRGQEVCCFAHGEEELRTGALDRYSYWSIFGAVGAPGPRQTGPAIDLSMGQGYAGCAGRGGATGALYHPKVYKHRFCASYPNVVGCRRGDACAFAHTREEIRTSLLGEDEELQRPHALTNEFFMYKFKTLWCPIGVQHDWQTCVYAHNYQDARRHPGIGYGPRPCPYWKRKETTLEYSQRCPLGVRCPFSHGAKEQLYHPAYFKTVTCQDWPNSNCPRGKLCAFWHRRSQQRTRGSVDDEFNYKLPIPETCLSEALQADFLSPPFKLLNSLQGEVPGYPELGMDQEASYQEQQAMAQMNALGGGHCDPCGQPQNCNWGQSDMPAFCNFLPATPTTTAGDSCSDDVASADSSQEAKVAHEEDRSVVGALGKHHHMDMNQMMPPPLADMPWQQGLCDPQQQMWAAENPWASAGPPYPGDGFMASPNGAMPSLPNGSMGPGGMPGPMPNGSMPDQNMPGTMPGGMAGMAGNMSGGMSPGHMGMPGQDPFHFQQQQQMVYYQVPPHGMAPNGMPPSPMVPNGMPNGMPPSGMGPNGMPMSPHGMPPMSPNAMPMAPMSPHGGPQMMLPPQGFEQQSQTCTYWGQPGAPLPANGYDMYGCGGGYEPRPLMTIEELPPQAYQAIQEAGKFAAISNVAPAAVSEFFPAPVAPSSPSNGGEVKLETRMGFIHFKDTEASDESPTGRPRANSH